MATQWKEQCIEDAFRLSVEEQHDLAKKLAANCGYQLVKEDDERSLKIKKIIKIYEHNKMVKLIG